MSNEDKYSLHQASADYHGGNTRSAGFSEDFISERQDPLSPTHQDFPFDDVARALGEDVDLERDDVREMVANAIAGIMRFCLNTDITNKRAEQIIGRRLIALAWVLNPGLFEGSPSLIKLSKRMGMKSPFALHILSGEVTRNFGIKNRAQAHAWNRKGATAHTLPFTASGVLDTSVDAEHTPDTATAQPATSAPTHPTRHKLPIKKGKESFSGGNTELVPKQAGTHA